jgi:hypothetical protein
MIDGAEIAEFCTKLEGGSPVARKAISDIVLWQLTHGSPPNNIVITLALMVEWGLIGEALERAWLKSGESPEYLINSLIASSFEKVMPGFKAVMFDVVSPKKERV